MIKDLNDLYVAEGDEARGILEGLKDDARDAVVLALSEAPEGTNRERYVFAKEHVLPLLVRIEDPQERDAAVEDVADALKLKVGNLRKALSEMVEDLDDEAEEGDDTDEASMAQADRLIRLAQEEVQALFTDQHGAPHALVDGEPIPLNSRCYSWLRRLMWHREQRSCRHEALSTAAGTLAAQAEFSGEVRELHTRAAWHEGRLYYELATGNVVEVDSSGYREVREYPVLFRRIPNLKPLPTPVSGGSLDPLEEFVNLRTERAKRLYKAYAVTVVLPHISRPILLATGQKGSGKTTSNRVIKRLGDPSSPETVRLDREFLQKASHGYIILLDNQSALPKWSADLLCRLVTGEADSKRKLFTDDEDVIYELKRAILLNGINVPTDQGDVLDRALPIELERIPDDELRPEEKLWEEFEAARPQLLGAVFGVLSRALALMPSLELATRPRLADWGEYAAAVYEAMGWGADLFIEDWENVVKAQNRETLDGSPVAQAIIKFMEDLDEYGATSSKLHKQLEEVAAKLGVVNDREWPKSARWLWRRINEVRPLLSAVGIEASREEVSKGSIIILRKTSKNDATDATDATGREDDLSLEVDLADEDDDAAEDEDWLDEEEDYEDDEEEEEGLEDDGPSGWWDYEDDEPSSVWDDFGPYADGASL